MVYCADGKLYSWKTEERIKKMFLAFLSVLAPSRLSYEDLTVSPSLRLVL